eukprot:16279-Eustigmatos_ZCMA.PRE.1
MLLVALVQRGCAVRVQDLGERLVTLLEFIQQLWADGQPVTPGQRHNLAFTPERSAHYDGVVPID